LKETSNLGDLIDRGRPLEKAAVIDLGGERPPRERSYAELDALADGVARLLMERGLARGERVAILSANRSEFIAAYFGILRAGLVAVPVNFKFPPRQIDFVLRDSDARLVFCDALRRKDVPVDLPAVDLATLSPGPRFEPVKPSPGETAMFLYTSGSTGRPKGVVLSHQSHLWVVHTRLGGKDWSHHRLLIAAPLYHMNALALSQLAAAAHATVVLMPQFSARDYIEAIEKYRCTWLTAVPPMMAMMLREKDLLERIDLSSVELLRMGSAPVSASLMERLHALFPKASIVNAYGTTEAGPVVFGPHPNGLPQPELSVGYPHPGVALRRAEGVLQMKSPAMMTAYHKLPEATRAAFTDDGYYRTGDVFSVDENGFYTFVGRVDDMFVSGGENIYPSEVEKMLESHPAVEQAAVIAVPDEIKGAKPVAFVVLKRNRQAGEEELKHYALDNAPAYQHPRRVWFLPELPLAGTNKVDRKALARRAEAEMTAGSHP
jgi:acyl-CoA synthetase (AMP-forming)/AMP-acid ligase II